MKMIIDDAGYDDDDDGYDEDDDDEISVNDDGRTKQFQEMDAVWTTIFQTSNIFVNRDLILRLRQSANYACNIICFTRVFFYVLLDAIIASSTTAHCVLCTHHFANIPTWFTCDQIPEPNMRCYFSNKI